MYQSNINYGQPQVPMATTVPVQGAPPQMYPPQAQPMPGYAPQPSYGVDQTSFSAPRPLTPPAPAVEVGFFDKVKSYFNDVYRSDDNLRAYKAFQQTVETDPNTLKPGSFDKTRVTDLQQRLNIAGIQANVNGVYGYATGEAVKEFKRMMNLNDGFLDSNGKPAVTDIATPQMQSVLNSVVSKQLNPQMPGTGNNMPVTQEELFWAQNLATRVQSFGYQPNAQERARYDDILARQQAQAVPGMQPPQNSPAIPGVPTGQQVYPQQPQQPPVQPAQPPVQVVSGGQVSQQELDWAMSMQERIVSGYRPNAQEAAMYDNIQKRYAAQQAQPVQPSMPTGPVTQDELAWVRSKEGQQLSPQEMAKYQNIMERYLAQQTGTTGPQPAGQLNPVTQAELEWALQLQERMATQGYQPSAEEAARYTDIYNRYQNQPTQVQPTQPATPTPPPGSVYQPGETAPVVIDNTVTQEELQWAVELQRKIDTQGYRPTQQEVVRYTDIYNRYQASQQQPAQPTAPAQPSQPAPQQPVAPQQPAQPPTPVGASQDELQWARRLESRTAQGYKPTAEEVAKYNEIQLKLATFGMQPATGPVAPTAPTSTGPVSQAEIDWALQLQQRVQFQGYQPTEQEIAQYTDIFTRYQQQQTAPAPAPQQPVPVQPAPQQPAPVQPAAPVGSGPPTAEEIQWAQQLQTAVQQGYQASDAEIARYTNIFERMQQFQGQPQPVAPQQPVAPVAPVQTPPAPGSVMINVNAADPELQWAMELLNRYRQGYQPSQSELMMYERIIANKAVPGATP